MTLREVFHEAEASRLYRYLHFPSPASAWTLDIEVLVEEPDPNEPDHPVWPHPIAEGHCATVFSTDVELVVHYADQLCGCADDDERLSALRYYYHHGHRVFEGWQPARQRA